MPTINPQLVPTIAPGRIFSQFTTNTSLNVRWITPQDPVYYEVANRPLADVVVRQLVLAKAVDQLELALGHEALFPYLVQPQVSGTEGITDVPIGWVWDIDLSLPNKWYNIRLAKIKRLGGTDGTDFTAGTVGPTGNWSGTVRLIFTAVQAGDLTNTETAIFSADYDIASILSYQREAVTVVTSAEEAVCIDPSEAATVCGYITFRTLDLTDFDNTTFLEAIAPSGTPAVAVYQIVDSPMGTSSITGDFDLQSISHGTGMLTDSATNAIPTLFSDTQAWIDSFNYPFETAANLTSTGTYHVVIPTGLFQEFNITAPAGDEPTGDVSGTYYPVWISKIEVIGTDLLRLVFTTYNVTDTSPSTAPVDFATLDLSQSMAEGQIVAIHPLGNLELNTGGGAALFTQHMGRGHVMLSRLWNGSSSLVSEWFTSFDTVEGTPPTVEFTKSSTRLGPFGISRIPKYVPTQGQSQALVGSTARLDAQIDPSDSNRYVCELDQGLGNKIDLEAVPDVTPQASITRYGYTGGLVHRLISMCMDASQLPPDNTTAGASFYEDQILPRLTALLGRPPQFGDYWWDGSGLRFFNGDTWERQ